MEALCPQMLLCLYPDRRALGSSVDVIIAVQFLAFLSGPFSLCGMTH